MSIYMSRAELEEISEGLITAYANKFNVLSFISSYAVDLYVTYTLILSSQGGVSDVIK